MDLHAIPPKDPAKAAPRMWLRPKSDSPEASVGFVLYTLASLGVVVGIWIAALNGHLFPSWLWEVGRVGGRRLALARRGRLSLVSSRPPSNRACGSPAHGSPTFFTVGIQRPGRHGRLGRGATMIPLRLTRPMRLGLATNRCQP
jgi:hypothetical protein